MEKRIMKIMDEITYGFPDKNNKNISETDPKKWDENFCEFYYLLSPEELLESKYGVCFDQVELERYLFNKKSIKVTTYFICMYDNENLPSHSFLTYKKNDKYYWFEHSWEIHKGIHEYNTKNDLLLDVKEKFIKSQNTTETFPTIIYKYELPKYHLTCIEYYKHCENGKMIDLKN